MYMLMAGKELERLTYIVPRALIVRLGAPCRLLKTFSMDGDIGDWNGEDDDFLELEEEY